MSERSSKLRALRPKGLRLASEVSIGFPYRAGDTAYVVIADGQISSPQYVSDRRAAAKALRDGKAQVFAVWPGDYRSDLFVIDDPSEFFEAYPS